MNDWLSEVLKVATGTMAGLLIGAIGYGIRVRRELDKLSSQASQSVVDLASFKDSTKIAFDDLKAEIHAVRDEQVKTGKALAEIIGRLSSGGKITIDGT